MSDQCDLTIFLTIEFYREDVIHGTCSTHWVRNNKTKMIALDIHKYAIRKNHPLNCFWTTFKSLPFMPCSRQPVQEAIKSLFKTTKARLETLAMNKSKEEKAEKTLMLQNFDKFERYFHRNYGFDRPRYETSCWSDVHVAQSVDEAIKVLNSSNNISESLNRSLNRLVTKRGKLTVAASVKALTQFKRINAERLLQLEKYNITGPENREASLATLVRLQCQLRLKTLLDENSHIDTTLLNSILGIMYDLSLAQVQAKKLVTSAETYAEFQLEFCRKFGGAEILFENQRSNDEDELNEFELNNSFAPPDSQDKSQDEHR